MIPYATKRRRESMVKLLELLIMIILALAALGVLLILAFAIAYAIAVCWMIGENGGKDHD